MGRLIDADEVNEAIYKNFEDIQFYDGTGYDIYSDSKEIIDKIETVEAIPKADYKKRLKADLEAILVELQLEIHELENPYPHDYDNLLPLAQHNAFYDAKSSIEDLVDEKINELRAGQER